MSASYNTAAWLVVVALSGAALFFTVQVESFKRQLNSPEGLVPFSSGQKAQATRIIDGDELLVKTGASQFVVRILGISSFDPAVDDPVMENVAKDAFRHLETAILNNEVELVFEQFKKDSRERVLAYVHKGDIDIGLDMVTRGYSIVYTRYPFPRMEAYLVAERAAMRNRKGLWATPVAAQRALGLRRVWERELAREWKP